MTPSLESFSNIFDSDWFGPWGPWLQSAHIGDDPVYNNHSNLPDALYSLKGFKCMFAVANHQANDLIKNST